MKSSGGCMLALRSFKQLVSKRKHERLGELKNFPTSSPTSSKNYPLATKIIGTFGDFPRLPF